MKVLFMDIDGVLNTDCSEVLLRFRKDGGLRFEDLEPVAIDWWQFEGEARTPDYPNLSRYRQLAKHDLDYDKVKLVAYLVKHCDARVVISSSWRLNYTAAEIDFIFRAVYSDWPENRIIDCTEPGTYEARDIHIKNWLDQNPNVEEQDYVILDDKDYFHGQRLRRFVHIDPTFGLTPIEVCIVMRMFGVDPDDIEDRVAIPNFLHYPVRQMLENMMAACGLDWLDKAKIREHFKQPSRWPSVTKEQLTDIYKRYDNSRSS